MRPGLLIFINSLDIGGSERVVSMLLQHLHNDFDIHLAMYHKTIQYKIPEDIKILDLKQPLKESRISLFIKAPSLAKRLTAYCKEHNIQTTVAFLYRPCFITALMKTRYGFKGYVVMCERTHQSSILKSYSTFFKLFIRQIIRYAYRNADLILTNSHIMQQDLVDNLRIRTPSQVIYNPVDISFVQQQCKEEPDFDFKDDTFYFISVGGFRREKNQLLLIEAFNRIRDMKAEVIFVGGGVEEGDCRKRVKELGLENKISFCGFDNNPFKYICRSDCFVLTSNVEGFPNVLLEALACEKAVIATDCPSGPRELLSPGTNWKESVRLKYEIAEFGILTPVNESVILSEAMKRMYDDTFLRAKFTAGAMERVKDFRLSHIGDIFNKAFLKEKF